MKRDTILYTDARDATAPLALLYAHATMNVKLVVATGGESLGKAFLIKRALHLIGCDAPVAVGSPSDEAPLFENEIPDHELPLVLDHCGAMHHALRQCDLGSARIIVNAPITDLAMAYAAQKDLFHARTHSIYLQAGGMQTRKGELVPLEGSDNLKDLCATQTVWDILDHVGITFVPEVLALKNPLYNRFYSRMPPSPLTEHVRTLAKSYRRCVSHQLPEERRAHKRLEVAALPYDLLTVMAATPPDCFDYKITNSRDRTRQRYMQVHRIATKVKSSLRPRLEDVIYRGLSA